MIKKAVKSIYSQPLLLINSVIEGILGLWMILAPASMQTLGSVEIPLTLIQTCGLLALTVAAFSKLGAIYIAGSKDKKTTKIFVCTNLAIFNSALAVGLLYSAIHGDINFLGALIHLPLAIAFAISAISSSRQQSAQ